MFSFTVFYWAVRKREVSPPVGSETDGGGDLGLGKLWSQKKPNVDVHIFRTFLQYWPTAGAKR